MQSASLRDSSGCVFQSGVSLCAWNSTGVPVRLFNTRYGGLVVRITVLCLFLHTFQRENTYAKLHENAPFEMKNYINFLGRGHCPPPQTHTPPGREIPPPRTLFPRAFHGQLPRMSSDPRNAPDYNTIIKERVVYSAAALTCVAPVNSLGRTVAGPSGAILTVIFSNLSLAADAFRAGRKSRYAPV